MPEGLFLEAFTLWGAATTWLEVVAFGLSLAMVFCNIREVHWGWPLAMASSALYGLLFWHIQLLGEASLQVFFVIVAAWGWWQWRHGACRTWSVDREKQPQRGQFLPDLQPHSPAMGQKVGEKWTAAVDLQPTISKSDRLPGDPGASTLRIQVLAPQGRVRLLVLSLLAWPVTAGVLMQFTRADLPWWDALPTALSVIGQVLLGRKFLENWWVWCVVNAVSVGLFAYKQLWLTALLYALFLWLSVLGARAWQGRLHASP